MHNPMVTRAQPTFDDLEAELSIYLTQRFASKGFAEKIIQETRKRLEDGEILSLVGDVRVYLCSFAMAIGQQLLEEKYVKKF